MCISVLQMQMQFFWVCKCTPLPIKCKIVLRVLFGILSVCMHFDALNSCMCGALTTTALWWVPKPALLGCSLQPDARVPSCPSYSGSLFPCTLSPGPRTRWAADPHKYFLSCNSYSWIETSDSLCGSIFLSVFTLAENQRTKVPHCFKVWKDNIIEPITLAVHAVNVHYFHECALVFWFSLAFEVNRQRLSKVQSSYDRDLWESALPEVPQDLPGKVNQRVRQCFKKQHSFRDMNILLTANLTQNLYHEPVNH